MHFKVVALHFLRWSYTCWTGNRKRSVCKNA